MRYFLTFCLLYQFITGAKGQSSVADKLDSLFSKMESQDKFYGSIAISLQGKKEYFNSAGSSRYLTRQKIDSTSTFAIGSITKSFIAALTMMLAEEGKLKTNDHIRKWFPQMPSSEDITVDDLLKHQSGLTDKNYFNWKYQGKKLKLVKHPEYANVNYGLIGLIIEDIEGKPLSRVMKERFFVPLHLDLTSFGPDILMIDKLVPYFNRESEQWQAVDTASFLEAGAAGAMISHPEDVNTFFTALFNHQFISQGSLDKMTEMKSGFGMGLFNAGYYQHKAYSNSGQFGTYQSTVVYFPEYDLCVSLMSNRLNYSMNLLLKEVLDICFKNGTPGKY